MRKHFIKLSSLKRTFDFFFHQNCTCKKCVAETLRASFFFHFFGPPQLHLLFLQHAKCWVKSPFGNAVHKIILGLNCVTINIEKKNYSHLLSFACDTHFSRCFPFHTLLKDRCISFVSPFLPVFMVLWISESHIACVSFIVYELVTVENT